MDAERRRGFRLVVGWVWRTALLAVVLVVATVGLYVLGTAGERLGWLVAPVLLAVTSGGLALLLFVQRRHQRTVAATVAVIGLVGGVALRVVTPMMHSRLAGAVSSVDLPGGTSLVESLEFGNAACFDSCPSLLRRYEVPGAPDEVRQTLAAAFRSDGWTVSRDRYTVRSFTALSPDALVEARVTVAPEPPADSHENPEELPTVADGHVLVDLDVSENPCPPGEPGCP